jgi:hypothetical protein
MMNPQNGNHQVVQMQGNPQLVQVHPQQVQILSPQQTVKGQPQQTPTGPQTHTVTIVAAPQTKKNNSAM